MGRSRTHPQASFTPPHVGLFITLLFNNDYLLRLMYVFNESRVVIAIL